MRPRMLLPALLLLSCGEGGGGAPAPAPAPAPGRAELVWEATASGDEEAAGFFRRLAPSRARAVYGADRVRIEVLGGIAPGTMIVDPGTGTALRLDPARERSEAATGFVDLGVRPDVVLEATGATETIAGRTAREFRVTDSPDVREGAEIRVWLDPDLPVPVCRYRAEFALSRLESPLPVRLSGPDGAVLRAVSREAELTVTWTAVVVRPGAPDPALLRVPDGYAGPR